MVCAEYIVYIAYDCSCWKTIAVTQFWQYCIFYMCCMYREVQTRYITLLIVYCVCSIYCVYSVWLLVLKNCGSCTVLTVLHILCDVRHGDAILEALRENSAEEKRAHVRNHRCQRCFRACALRATTHLMSINPPPLAYVAAIPHFTFIQRLQELFIYFVRSKTVPGFSTFARRTFALFGAML